MQSFIVNNILLNELASRILTSKHSAFKKLLVSIIILLSLSFYGLESLIRGLNRQ